MHGRWSYVRNAGLIQYSMYKNTAVFLVQFWFAFYCGYSAMTIYDDWVVTFFNILFTSAPPFLYGVLERDIGEDLIDEYPEAFRTVQTGDHLTYSSMFLWEINAIWHSIVFFFACVLLLQQEPFMWNGKTSGIRMLGNMCATMAITTVILKYVLETYTLTALTHIFVWVSLGAYYLLLLIETLVPSLFPLQYWIMFVMFSQPLFWLTFLMVITICLVPDICAKLIRRQFFPDDWMILQEVKKFKIPHDDLHAKQMEGSGETGAPKE